MEREEIEYIAALIDITVTNTLSKLDLIKENISESKAKQLYGLKLLEQWKHNRWIIAYQGDGKRQYFKRSELERARLMMESIRRKGPDGKITNTRDDNSINQIIEEIRRQVIELLQRSSSKETTKVSASKKTPIRSKKANG